MAERTKSKNVARWQRRALKAEARIAELLDERASWVKRKLEELAGLGKAAK